MVDYLGERAQQFGLLHTGIETWARDVFENADSDASGELSVVEAFCILPDLENMLLQHQPNAASKRSSLIPGKGLRDFFQQYFQQIRHRKSLNREFNKIDTLKTGWITVGSLVSYIVDQFDLNLPEEQEKRFRASICYYARLYGCFQHRTSKISRTEFASFWMKFTDLYRRIDSNNGFDFYNVYSIYIIWFRRRNRI